MDELLQRRVGKLPVPFVIKLHSMRSQIDEVEPSQQLARGLEQVYHAKASQLGAGELVSILRCTSRFASSHPSAPFLSLIEATLSSLCSREPLKPRDLAELVAAYSRLSQLSDASLRFLKSRVKQALEHDTRFCARDLEDLLLASRKLGRHNDALNLLPLIEAQLRHLAAMQPLEIISLLRQIRQDRQSHSNRALQSMAETLQAALAALPLEQLSTRDLTEIYTNLATLRFKDDRLRFSLQKALTRSRLAPKDITEILLHTPSFPGSTSQLLLSLVEQTRQQLPEFEERDLTNTFSSLAKLELGPDPVSSVSSSSLSSRISAASLAASSSAAAPGVPPATIKAVNATMQAIWKHLLKNFAAALTPRSFCSLLASPGLSSAMYAELQALGVTLATRFNFLDLRMSLVTLTRLGAEQQHGPFVEALLGQVVRFLAKLPPLDVIDLIELTHRLGERPSLEPVRQLLSGRLESYLVLTGPWSNKKRQIEQLSKLLQQPTSFRVSTEAIQRFEESLSQSLQEIKYTADVNLLASLFYQVKAKWGSCDPTIPEKLRAAALSTH